MRTSIVSAATLLALASTVIAGNFDFYPKGSQTCLEAALKQSKCSGEGAERNKCLCTNGGGFVTSSAKCLGKHSNTRDIAQSVYSTMASACDDSKTPLSVEQSAFLKVVKDTDNDDDDDDDDKKKTTTTSSATKTPSKTTSKSTPTSTPASKTTSKSAPTNTDTSKDNDNNDNNNNNNNSDGNNNSGNNGGDNKKSGLSTGAIAGIAVGCGVAGIAGIAVLLAFLRRRRAIKAEEARPMLNRGFGNEDGSSMGQEMRNEPSSGWDGAAAATAYNPRSSAYTQPTISPEPQYQQQYSPSPQQSYNGTPQLNQPQQFSPHHSFNAVPAAAGAAVGAAGAAGFAAAAVPAWHNNNQSGSPAQRYEAYAAPPLVSQNTTPDPPAGFAELAPETAPAPKPAAPVFEMDGGPSISSQPPQLPEIVHPPSLQPPGLQSQERR